MNAWTRSFLLWILACAVLLGVAPAGAAAWGPQSRVATPGLCGDVASAVPTANASARCGSAPSSAPATPDAGPSPRS